MDPTHKALLAELLQRATAMPVREASQSLRVEPDAVYVIPPNTELSVVGGRLQLADPMQPRGMRLPIDVLFASLARDQGERAIGVLLSGMGADGRQGLQAIKTQGGLTLAQHPDTAQFDMMPKSAIAAGCGDIVAPPANLPAAIASYVARVPDSARESDETARHALRPPLLDSILRILQAHTRHDCSAYKPSGACCGELRPRGKAPRTASVANSFPKPVWYSRSTRFTLPPLYRSSSVNVVQRRATRTLSPRVLLRVHCGVGISRKRIGLSTAQASPGPYFRSTPI
jgi:hypothetical protein